jgi:hypothetical protein
VARRTRPRAHIGRASERNCSATAPTVNK